MTTLAVLLPVGARAERDGLPAPDVSAARSVEGGAFLPTALAARSDTQRAIVFLQGGWDRARGGALFDSRVESTLFGPVSLRAGATWEHAAATLAPTFEVKLDALRQERHGVDLAVTAGYEGIGFNLVPAFVTRASVGRRLGATTLVGNVAYGQGLDLEERHGDLRLAGVHRFTRRLWLGLDARVRVDLERDDDEPAGEAEWAWMTGPVATWAAGAVAVSLSAGVSAVKLRDGRSDSGPAATAGVGLVF